VAQCVFSSRTPGLPGIKSSAVRLGADPGNTQGSLEVVKKPSSPVKVVMGEAEHAYDLRFVYLLSVSIMCVFRSYMLFKKSRAQPTRYV
jgi:hypothetical protein